MSRSGKPVADDENDTLLFEKLEENAIAHYPNPSRRGCPPQEVLEKFVESPNEVSVGDLNDLHVFHCAECTLDLKRLREARQAKMIPPNSPRRLPQRAWWVGIAAVVLIAVSIPIVRYYADKRVISSPEYVAHLVLRDGSDERGAETGIVIPRVPVTLDMELGSEPSAGTYEVVMSKQRSMDTPVLKWVGMPATTSSGSRVEPQFDLRRVPQGGYWIGVRSNASGRIWFTFISIE